MNKSKNQFIKYAMVGVVGICVEWIFFFIFRNALGVPYWLAHPLGCIMAIINNFFLNYYFTFKTRDNMFKRAVSFFSIAGVGIAVSSTLLPLGVYIIHNYVSEWISFIDLSNKNTVENISKLAATGFVAVCQFFFNKRFTFKPKGEGNYSG